MPRNEPPGHVGISPRVPSEQGPGTARNTHIGVAYESREVFKERSWKTFFSLCVVLGLFGELCVAIRQAGLGAKLHAIEAAENTDLQKRIADAQTEAKKAQTEEDQLHLRITEGQKDLAATRLQIDSARAAAAEASARAAAADLARVQLEQRIAPRHLTPKEQSRVAAKIDRFGGTKVSLVFTADIFE